MDIYEGNGRILVVPDLCFPVCEESSEIFERLRDLILSHEFPVTDVVFEGGGSFPIPDWFRDFCEKCGIKIHVLTEDAEIPVPHEESKAHE
jgi:hypothetical protein